MYLLYYIAYKFKPAKRRQKDHYKFLLLLLYNLGSVINRATVDQEPLTTNCDLYKGNYTSGEKIIILCFEGN